MRKPKHRRWLHINLTYGVTPLPWLTDVLSKLAGGWPAERLEELLPDRWQVLHRVHE